MASFKVIEILSPKEDNDLVKAGVAGCWQEELVFN